MEDVDMLQRVISTALMETLTAVIDAVVFSSGDKTEAGGARAEQAVKR